jgi:hypothetical protein
MTRRRPLREASTCPHCGASFKAGRLACPECGSDAATGWRDAEEIDVRSVEIPDTYEELVGGAAPRRRRRWTVIVALLLLVALLPYLLSLF